jgi:4-hydroxy-4-methyl-2-oxoglutarate aldolase
MIDDPPVLTIRRGFARPPAAALAALAGVPTGWLVDALGGQGALDYRIKPLTGIAAAVPVVVGTAVTCWCGPADNLALFAAVEAARAGDVIVAATGAHAGCSLTGDLLAGMARNRGVAAIVTDGLVRDVTGILKVGLPVWCCGVSPNSPARLGPGSVGLPVTLGGMSVDSGDVVLADRDGVVIAPRAALDSALAGLERVKAAEAALEAKVEAGLEVPDFIARILKSDRVRLVE